MAHRKNLVVALRQRGLPLAQLPGPLLAYVLVVDVVVGAGAITAVASWRPGRHDMWVAALFLVIAVLFEELSGRFTRLQHRISSELKRDMSSVWAVAASVALHIGAGVVLLVVLLSFVWHRQRRGSGHPFYRMWFSSTAAVGGFLCASATVSALTSTLTLPWSLTVSVSIAAAMAAYTLVNRLLVTGALVGSGVRGRALLGSRDDNLAEISTLCLGGLVAVAALNEPWLCVLVLAPMAVLQRASLVRELEAAAIQDAKTGLLNAVAWEQLARKELAHAQRTSRRAGILIIDIDRFKVVNDRFGHLVGDKVLAGVARAANESLRGYDGLGRFGGEEFVAVLPDADERAALVVAERVRLRVSQLQLTEIVPGLATDPGQGGVKLSVSIGVAVLNSDGVELPELLHAADQALYRAKWNGRNQVQLARRGDQLPDMINL